MVRRSGTLKSGKVWEAFYFDGLREGKRYFYPLGNDLKAALRKWADLQGTKRAENGTFDSVADRYVKDVLPAKPQTTQDDYQNSIKQLRKVFGPHPLEAVKTKHLAQYRDKRSAKVRANRELAVFSILWNQAREWGVTDLPNPVQGLHKNKETPRTRLVSKDEYQAVYEKADYLLKDALDLAYLTAQRPADVLKMSMADIGNGELLVKQGKTGKTVRISIEGRLSEVIARAKERARSAPIAHFALLQTETGRPLSKGMLRVRFDAARTAAGVSFQYRDLRPMGLTAQPDLEAARALAGHGTSAITSRVYRRAGEKARPNE
jgi:integrase